MTPKQTTKPVARYAIWQWGRKLATGTRAQCVATRKRWMAMGNIELEIHREP